MIYLRWGKSEIEGIERFGLSHIVTECGADGSVLREIGFDDADMPVHRAPIPPAIFLFDSQLVDLSNKISVMSAAQFDAAWLDAGLPPNNSFKPNPLRGSA
ncbi:MULTISPECIES: hypothetical protein [unclassified Pseudoxanthomonas]|uniref:hypothetical protein n=1 Tax=unclassified Pseudoxanthomonas TaxID=2645906 RepID=UPI0008E795D5|nr:MULTISPECIES: hypothetical protein [unclassified Pseudoxanthomonas]PPJ42860.1 hypothetical protein C0063_06320 [Pseudoxanthomonas sp. KAs_5_3]SFV33488.1 hypothetical protein SAMN05428990_2335 [Pseudoxanthomonas sp. YR558]